VTVKYLRAEKRAVVIILDVSLAPVVVRAGVRARGAFTKLKLEIL
jgi:hypothetical protein